jgi:hypothetical protein
MGHPPTGPGDGPRMVRPDHPGSLAPLVAEAARNAEAAAALAACHAELPTCDRRALIEAVWTDGRAAGHDPGPALVALLAVEDDVANARRLRELLEGQGPGTLWPVAAPQAWLGGDADGGSAIVAEPLHGRFLEVMGVAWRDGRVTRHTFEPLTSADDLSGLVARLGLDPPPRPAPPDLAKGVMAEALWQHRRSHGPLPTGMRHFARML